MDRRTYLVTSGTSLAGLFAGCTSENTTTTPEPTPSDPDPATEQRTPSPTSITVTSRDATASNPDVSLDITYATHTQSRLPTDPVTLAEEGYTWLLVRMDVTNTGDAARDLRMYQYILDSGSKVYEPNITDESWALAEKSVAAGDTVTGWVVFYPSTSLQEGELRIRDNTQPSFNITFTHDASLDARIPE